MAVQTIEEAIGAGPWYGQTKVAYLNDAGDLVLIERTLDDHDDSAYEDEDPIVVPWLRPKWIVRSCKVVTGSDAEKLKALDRFQVNLRAVA